MAAAAPWAPTTWRQSTAFGGATTTPTISDRAPGGAPGTATRLAAEGDLEPRHPCMSRVESAQLCIHMRLRVCYMSSASLCLWLEGRLKGLLLRAALVQLVAAQHRVMGRAG